MSRSSRPPMSVVEVPAEIAQALLEELMPSPLKALFAALREDPAPDPQGPQADDIRGLLKVLNDELVRELHLQAKLAGPRLFQSRVLTYAKETRKKSELWHLTAVAPTGTPPLVGGPAMLRDLMDQEMREREGQVALWVHALPPLGDDEPLHLVLARHLDGLEMLFLLRDRRWARASVAPEHCENLLLSVFSPKKDNQRWLEIGETLAKALASPSLREANAFLRSKNKQELTEAELQGVLTCALRNELCAVSLSDIARVSSHPPLREAHRLMESAARALTQALKMGSEKLAQAEKDHTRSVRKLRNDLDKTKLALEGITRRAKTVETENQALRRAKDPAAPVGAPAQPLAQLLDALFVSD